MPSSRALILGLLMLGSTIHVESQRAPQKWWNELKSLTNNADASLSDDQLMTEASRLSSNLVRVPAPTAAAEKRVRFDDQPFDSLGSESQFMRRSTVFDSQDNIDNSRDRIWSYFDSKLKNRDVPQSSSTGTTGSLFSSFERRQNPSSSTFNSHSSDDFFSRHFKRNSNNPEQDSQLKNNNQYSSKQNSKTSPNKNSKDRVLALDLGQSRRKNPEEKERWNQLIKTIFETSPRSSSAPNQYGNGEYDFKSMTKTKIVEPNDIDDNVITEKSMRFDPSEDALNEDNEKSVNTRDMQMETDQATDSSNAKTATTMSSIIQDEGEEEPEERSDEQEENNDNETGTRKRHATEAPTPMEQEEEEDEASNTVDQDEDNQYLRPQNKSKLARPPPTTSGTTPATVNLNTKTPTRRQPQNTPSSDSFGSRIHRSNITNSKKPSFTMHFEMGKKKIDDKMITELKKDPMFHPVDPSTPTTTPRASTEAFEGVSREMMEEMDNSLESTTPLPLTTTLRPFKNRKSASGKWMDSETFKLNEDRSMIVDPNEDEEDDEAVTDSPTAVNKRPSRMSSSTLTTRSPPVIQKRKLQTQVRRKAVMANFRPVRQNSEFLDDDSHDDLGRLSKALPGTPGQDYPTLGSIPKTMFDCSAHEWPGYYADVDTQCQVFHICQSGGRRDSFLCPNGTMFNQQLFICDWWHNVNCPEVTQHYALNQQIYDYSWESKRMSNSAANMPQRARLAKRMGVSEASTTPAPITVSPTSTISTNADQVWRRAQQLQGGTKGGKSRFGRQANNERNAIKAFFERYKYVQSTTEAPTTEKTSKIIAASGSAPVLTFTTINDHTVRHPKHHRA